MNDGSHVSRTIQEPPRHIGGAHWDASNLAIEVTLPTRAEIYSAKTGARLVIHRLGDIWVLRVSLVWQQNSGFGGGSAQIEVRLSTHQLVHLFDLQDGQELLFEPNASCRREYEHVTVPAYHGTITDGVPCISIHLTTPIKDGVRQLVSATQQSS